MKITIEQLENAGYSIQRDGIILNTRGKPFKPRLNNDGYDVVIFRLSGVTVQKLRHRVIAAKYLPRPAGCLVVNHKDKNKLNLLLRIWSGLHRVITYYMHTAQRLIRGQLEIISN